MKRRISVLRVHKGSVPDKNCVKIQIDGLSTHIRERARAPPLRFGATFVLGAHILGGIIVRQEEQERTRGFAFASALLPFRILFVNHKGLLIDGVGFRRRALGVSKSMPMASPRVIHSASPVRQRWRVFSCPITEQSPPLPIPRRLHHEIRT